MPLFFDRDMMPKRPKPPQEAPGLNDAHAEMNAARQIYNILNMLKRPGARERTIAYVMQLLGVDYEHEPAKKQNVAPPPDARKLGATKGQKAK